MDSKFNKHNWYELVDEELYGAYYCIDDNSKDVVFDTFLFYRDTPVKVELNDKWPQTYG